MDLIQAIFLGLLQGLTEWLPISSQGQVALAGLGLFNIAPEQALQYAIFLHTGTLISAVIYFRKELKQLIQGKNRALLKFLAIAVVVTGVTALPSYLFLKSLAHSSFYLLLAVGVFLIITGLIQWKAKRKGKAELENKNAFWLGLSQGFAVLPGISRSGMTTSALLFEGFQPEEAFRLSFLLSIPSVLIGELAFSLVEPVSFEPMLLVSVAVAAVVGLLSMAALIKVAKRINFSLFCIIFGLLYLVLAVSFF